MRLTNFFCFGFSTCFVMLLVAGVGFATQHPFYNQSSNTNLDGKWGVHEYPRNIATADMDNDGFKDIVVTFENDVNKEGLAVRGDYINTNGLEDYPVFLPSEYNCFNVGEKIKTGCSGMIFADFNNDGYSDFYAPNPNGHQLYCFNTTTGKYDEISDEIIDTSGFGGNTINGSWGDFNADGWIDLLILKYTGESVGCSYSSEQRLLVNNGGTGFTVVESVVSGIPSATRYIGSALWADFSGDGFVDLALLQTATSAIDPTTTYFKNVEDGQTGNRIMANFTNNSTMEDCIVEMEAPNNHSAVADANNDGALDIVYHSYYSYGVCLTNSDTPGAFVPFDTLQGGGPTGGGYSQDPPRTGDLAALDYDLDGNMDIMASRTAHGKETAVLRNLPDLTYRYSHWPDSTVVVVDPDGLGLEKGLCVADFTNDGYADVFLARDQNVVGKDYFMTGRKAGTTENNWIGIKLFAPASEPSPPESWFCNYDCIGATVVVHAGTHTQAQVVDGGSGRASQADRSLVFGLGDYGSNEIDSVVITLPGGSQVVYEDLEVNQIHRLSVNGAALDEASVDFSIEHYADGTEDWTLTWETDHYTNKAFDTATFSVDPSDEIEYYNGDPFLHYDSSVALTGCGTVEAIAGGKYQHSITLYEVICEGNRYIKYEAESMIGSCASQSSPDSVRIRFCVSQ